jgi:hypothetical protein
MEGRGRHRSRSRDRHRHHNRGKHEERHRHRNGSDERHRHRHRDRSGERHRRHQSRDRHRDEPRGHRERSRRRGRSNERRVDRDIPDPITESQPDSNPESMMTSSSEPTISPPAPSSPYQNPTQSRHRGLDTTQHAPSLPPKAPGTSFAAHVLNTYRHIKAEHDAGVRERGRLERTVDGWRGKPVPMRRSRDEPRKQDSHRGRRRQRSEEKESSEGGWRNRAQTPYAPRNVSPDESLLTPPAQSLSSSISEPVPTTSPPYPAAPSPPSVVRRKPVPANVLREMQRGAKVRRAGSLGGEDGSGVGEIGQRMRFGKREMKGDDTYCLSG